MDWRDIHRMLDSGEGECIEFKSEWPSNATEVARVLASFANTRGGTILFGVEDDGLPVGIPDPDTIMQRVAGVAQNACNPALEPSMGATPMGNSATSIVWVRVDRIADAPCLVESRCYRRVGPTSMPVTGGAAMKQMLRGGAAVLAHERASQRTAIPPLPQPKCFRGREHDVARLLEYVDSGIRTLILVEGMSGIGKTTLALRLATLLSDRGYRVCWVDCLSDTTLDEIVRALAGCARGYRDDELADLLDDLSEAPDARTRQIAAALSTRPYALFLDDYHLANTGQIERLLRELEMYGGQARAVIATRRRPHLLSVVRPIGVGELVLTQGLSMEAVTLLLLDHGLAMDDGMVRPVWEKCGCGHPKALELLIARLGSIENLPDLLDRLPAFREDVREAWLMPLIDELPAGQRELLVNLSIFDRPVSLDLLLSVGPSDEVEKGVVALLDRFLVDYGSEGLLQLHPLVRDFCRSLMPNIRAKHSWAADIYLSRFSVCGEADGHLEGETDYLLAAWSHLIKAGDNARAADLVRELRPRLMKRGEYESVMMLLDTTMPVDETHADWLELHRAQIYGRWGMSEEALDLLWPLLHDQQDRCITQETVLALADILNGAGMASESIEVLECHASLFMGHSSSRVTGRFVSRAVEAHLLLGNTEAAYEAASRMADACETRDDKLGAGRALRQMAVSLRARGDLTNALSLCSLSHDLLVEHGDRREAALAEVEIGEIRALGGDYVRARSSLKEAHDAFAAMGDAPNRRATRRRMQELEGVT